MMETRLTMTRVGTFGAEVPVVVDIPNNHTVIYLYNGVKHKKAREVQVGDHLVEIRMVPKFELLSYTVNRVQNVITQDRRD